MTSSSSEVRLVNKSHLKCRTDGSLLPKHLALLSPPHAELADQTALPAPPSHQKPSAPLSGWFPDNSVTWNCFGRKACARRKSGSRVGQQHPSLDQLRLAQIPNLGNSRELRVGNLPSIGQSIAGLRLDLILPHYPDCKAKMSGNTESHPHKASSQYWSQFAEFPVWRGRYCIARNWIFKLRIT